MRRTRVSQRDLFDKRVQATEFQPELRSMRNQPEAGRCMPATPYFDPLFLTEICDIYFSESLRSVLAFC